MDSRRHKEEFFKKHFPEIQKLFEQTQQEPESLSLKDALLHAYEHGYNLGWSNALDTYDIQH